MANENEKGEETYNREYFPHSVCRAKWLLVEDSFVCRVQDVRYYVNVNE